MSLCGCCYYYYYWSIHLADETRVVQIEWIMFLFYVPTTIQYIMWGGCGVEGGLNAELAYH